jgi:hypothetical protein
MGYRGSEEGGGHWHRTQQLVHEAMLTWRMMPRDKPLSHCGNAWPGYVLEYGVYTDEAEMRWKPTPKQIDDAFKVMWWFGQWRDRGRPKNGLHKWELALLELRAWQTTFGRESWEKVADALNKRHDCPTYHRNHWRIVHNQIIDIAVMQSKAETEMQKSVAA